MTTAARNRIDPRTADTGARLTFDRSEAGRVGVLLPPLDVPEATPLPSQFLRRELRLPEMAQNEIIRYFIGLSSLNYSVDTGFYPLGSCTMKYNPKINEDVARLPGFAIAHPNQPVETVQGVLYVLHELQEALREITGMDAVGLAPAAGAQGELCGILMIKEYLADRGEPQRRKVLVPDSAHGTNPATAAMAGFEVVTVPSDADGDTDLEFMRANLDENVAAMMLTLPSTLGLFDPNIAETARLLHEHGALLYGDGANQNAFLGRARFGDMGFDVVHLNLHKTFSTPHGGGGPGAGPVCVKSHLAPYLPAPVVEPTVLPSPANARTGVRMDGRGTSAAGGLGEGIPIRVTVTISGDNFHADFTGSAPERPTSINAVAAVTRSAVYYVVRCLLDEAVPSNDGCFRPVTLTLPERSVVNAGPPRAVAAGNVETSQRVTDVVLGALAQALPNVIPAASQGTMNNITIGGHLIPPSQATVGRGSSPEVFAPVLPRKERGAVGEATQHSALDTQHSFAYYETIAGGAGGSPTTPGLDAVHTHMTNTLNTPVEALEMAYPFRITEYAVRPGSGGPGRHPGGDGVTRTYEFLAPATVTLQTERRRLAPYALNGGHPGAPGRNTLERADAANVADGFSLPQGGAAGKRALESSPASRPARPEVSKDEAVARPPDPLLPPTSNLLPPKTLPSKTRLAVAPGDRLTIETPGGGGWGRPNAKLKADG